MEEPTSCIGVRTMGLSVQREEMKHISRIVILAAMCVGIALGQTTASPGNTAPAVRILAPNSGDKLAQSFVTVQFQLENPGSTASVPNFSIQLDDRDPVITAQTSQNFTGLTPGAHTVVIQLVDANNTPVAGGRAETRFTVVNPAAVNPEAPPQPARPPSTDAQAALPQSDAISDHGEPLPAASSALQLLSVIGFGALVGGILSALKTR